MVWIAGVLSFLVGLGAGVLLINILKPETERVKTLNDKLGTLQKAHDDYRNNVNTHFEDTARLMHQLTENYREVYRQLANDAQALCSEDVSSQLALTTDKTPLPGEEVVPPEPAVDETPAKVPETSTPPRDYATRTSPDQKGHLSEDYGMEKQPAGK